MLELHLANPWTERLERAVDALAQALMARGAQLSCAESCTGGLVAAACTSLAGSSRWFDRGFVPYSNQAKTDMLGVSPDLIAAHGAVSEPVALAMATGALKHSQANAALALSGIAGPGGGTLDKPVGTVCMGFATRIQAEAPLMATWSLTVALPGSRDEVRLAAACQALEGLAARLATR
jgi:nicotinamide-nucleotide amidase